MRFLILAHLGDKTALGVYIKLRSRYGDNYVKIVSSDELVFAPCWAHLLEDTQVNTDLWLSDGTRLDAKNIGVVFNRLLTLTTPDLKWATEADQEYSVSELNALCLSWLASIPCPVINAPIPPSLNAQTRSHAEWLMLAGKARLPVQGYHFTTDPRWFRENDYVPYQYPEGMVYNPICIFERIFPPPLNRQPTIYLEALSGQRESVLVAGSEVVGNLAGLYDEQLRYLAKISGCDLLRVIFDYSMIDSKWKVCGVDAFPYFENSQIHEAVPVIVQLLESKFEESKVR